LITYRVRLDVPRELILFVSRLPARRRKEIGTPNATASPSEIGPVARAALVLTLFEHKRLA
jgi:hypothetical protein